jgi:IK cytokine
MAQSQVAADDDLESAFLEASIPAPKKKTREELVKELKQARSSASAANVTQDGLDRAKIAGKFKPIGAPDNPLEKSKTKKKKRAKDGEEDRGRKKKKRRIESEPTAEAQGNGNENDVTPEQKVSDEIPNEDDKTTRLGPTKQKAPTPPPPDDDDDIFADAGEYKGLEISDEEEEDDKEERPKTLSKPSGHHSPPAGSLSDKPIHNWFGKPIEPDKPPVSIKPSSIAPAPVVSLSASSSKPQSRHEEHGDDLIEGAKLRGLTSSAVPSIKDLLAIDEAAEREEKRKAKKEKKKAKKLSEDAKLNREVKK